MIQIENEYGSYGEEKDYLRSIRDLMLDRGITVPFFTSGWTMACDTQSRQHD